MRQARALFSQADFNYKQANFFGSPQAERAECGLTGLKASLAGPAGRGKSTKGSLRP